MTTDEKIEAYIKGQGNQMDISGKLGALLDEIVDNVSDGVETIEVDLTFTQKRVLSSHTYFYFSIPASNVTTIQTKIAAGTPILVHFKSNHDECKLSLLVKDFSFAQSENIMYVFSRHDFYQSGVYPNYKNYRYTIEMNNEEEVTGTLTVQI